MSNSDHMNKLLEDENVYSVDEDEFMGHHHHQPLPQQNQAGVSPSDSGGIGKDGERSLDALMQKREQLERIKQQTNAATGDSSGGGDSVDDHRRRDITSDAGGNRRDVGESGRGAIYSEHNSQPLRRESPNARRYPTHADRQLGDQRSPSHPNHRDYRDRVDYGGGYDARPDRGAGGGDDAKHRERNNNGTDDGGNRSGEDDRLSREQQQDIEDRQEYRSRGSGTGILPPPEQPPLDDQRSFHNRPSSADSSFPRSRARTHHRVTLMHYPSDRYPPSYYFITKAYDYRDLKTAQNYGLWTVFKTEITNINLAVEGGEAILIFQLPKENRYFGFARVTKQIMTIDFKKNVKWFDTQEKKSRNFPIAFQAISDHVTFRDTEHLYDIDGTPINSVKNGRQIPNEAGKFICDLLRSREISQARSGPESHFSSRPRYDEVERHHHYPQQQQYAHHSYRGRDGYSVSPTSYHYQQPPHSIDYAPPSSHQHHQHPPPAAAAHDGYYDSRYTREDRYDGYDGNTTGYGRHPSAHHTWGSFDGGDSRYHDTPPSVPPSQQQHSYYHRSPPKRRPVYDAQDAHHPPSSYVHSYQRHPDYDSYRYAQPPPPSGSHPRTVDQYEFDRYNDGGGDSSGYVQQQYSSSTAYHPHHHQSYAPPPSSNIPPTSVETVPSDRKEYYRERRYSGSEYEGSFNGGGSSSAETYDADVSRDSKRRRQ